MLELPTVIVNVNVNAKFTGFGYASLHRFPPPAFNQQVEADGKSLFMAEPKFFSSPRSFIVKENLGYS